MITTVIMIGGYRIYTGWLIIGVAALIFIAAVVMHFVVLRKLNRKLKLAKLESAPSLTAINMPTATPSTELDITERLTTDDGTELLDVNGTELLDANGTQLLDTQPSQGDSPR